MIDKDNFKEVLIDLEFNERGTLLYKDFPDIDATLKVDFQEEKLIYPVDKGFTISGDFTTSFKQKENFVVFECVHRLFKKGYKPEHIELEPKWTVGHGASGGRADIMVKDNTGKSLLIVECKTAGKEFEDEWKKTLINGGQIFSYAKQAGSTQFVCLYTSDLIDNTVEYFNYIITLKDNIKLLEEITDKDPLSYEKAKLLDKEDIYKAWKETYSQDFSSKGIFEDDIPAYEIGKTKYSLKDLSTINNRDIQGKYHEFATILRQHNVSGRENAFDKLVNLFLCKIVDETNNPDELKFYWKGIAYDSFFELQDRLQKLYQEGMKRFLGEDVTYIDNDAIDNAFRFFKKDPDATRDTIKKYFRELKFFTNNDFAFIDVHNEKLFYQNSVVLLKVVHMLQDIQLKTEEQNQFLGDMFEGFLDQGVKQSEGQFFTPMPIVKFILNSLPLEQIIIENEQLPKVIDYACGAGHFLNEYAQQIKPIVEKHKDIEIQKYYKEIVGIEKEYRLSKVAKVSAFMYGQDDINIIYDDALATNPNIKDQEYSVLIANPPYSVKGFLETLSEQDRKNYELIQSIGEKSFTTNNSIETFFIERAKQLLKSEGIAGIIVPSSILNKGKAKSTSKSTNVYVACREILLKYFDIVAIAEFGSGTFGKTGTNTVTLFIRRKKDNPSEAEHYLNRVESWFNGDKSKNGVFEDEKFIKAYCNHIEISFNDYETLLEGKPNESLFSTEKFKDYRKEFEKWAEIKNRKKQRTFKNLTKEQQNAEIEKRFLEYVRAVEKEKLYYFVMASLNPQNVLIVKSPTKNTEIKEFLGYEWSSAKGKEGIKYLGGINIEQLDTLEEDEGNVDFEEEDKRVLNNIYNLANINTTLYDPNDINNKHKINYLIKENFKGENIEIPLELQDYASTARLVDMLDFSTTDFNKQINLHPPQNISINSKWDIVKISDIARTSSGGTPKSDNPSFYEGGTIPWINSGEVRTGVINSASKFITQLGLESSSAKMFPINTVLVAMYGATAGQVGVLGIEACTNQAVCGILPSDKYESSYLYYYLSTQLENLLGMRMGVARLNLSQDIIKGFKIPLPPFEIQRQIIEECEAIDKKSNEKEKTISDCRIAITEIQSKAYQSGYPMRKIDSISIDIQYGINDKLNTDGIGYKIFRMNEIIDGYMVDNENMKHVDVPKEEFDKYKLEKGDILFNRTNSIEHVGKTGLFNLDGDYCFASYLVRIKVDTEKADPKYVNYMMNSVEFQTEAKSKASKSINQANINATKMKNIEIPVPTDKKEQDKIVTDILKCENTINKAQEFIDNIQEIKAEIIRKYI